MQHTPILRTPLILLLVCFTFFLFGERTIFASSKRLECIISGVGYTEILNALGQSDLDHLYDAKMEDLTCEQGSIVRIGIPGTYIYECLTCHHDVDEIDHQLDESMPFLSQLGAALYEMTLDSTTPPSV